MINNLYFNAMAPGTPSNITLPIVDVLFANKSITSGNKYGPTPYVDIAHSYGPGGETNIGVVTTTIDLTGKILPTGDKDADFGFLKALNYASGLEQTFRDCVIGNFTIKNSGVDVYNLNNVYLKQINFTRTDNQWTKYIDYTATLEAKNPISGSTDLVENKVDIWTIEPLEDQTHVSYGPVVALNVDPRKAENSVGITGMPRFRISRTLSARGLPIPSTGVTTAGTTALSGCNNYGDSDIFNKMKFLNAKDWVNKESSGVFSSSASGKISLLPSGFFYNHSRTITADIYEGLYQINESWLAMPTGVGYIETFTLECSAQDHHTKTVKVNGNIIGLATGIKDLISHNDIFRSGEKNIKLDVTKHMKDTANVNKYKNALDGLSGIVMPQMYRRACLGVHHYAGRGVRIGANQLNAYQPSNPIYMKEMPLSPIPVSCQETHDPVNGTISYGYEFNNRYQAITGYGVVTENIRISDEAPVDNVSEIDLLNNSTITRKLVSLSRTNPRKTLSIELVVELPPKTEAMLRTHTECPLYIYGNVYSQIKKLVEGNKPFDKRDVSLWTANGRGASSGVSYIQNDQETWNPTEGKFTKNITWVYQHCEIKKPYLNH
jgi:hypothetical protein